MRLTIQSSRFVGTRSIDGVDVIIKAKIKQHYRHLPNGKIVLIKEHRDKRKDAKKEPEKFRHQVVHSDETSTSYMNHDNKIVKMPHDESRELDHDEKLDHLNQAMKVDKPLAHKVVMHEEGIKDYGAHLKNLVAAEKQSPNPRFKNLDEADDWFQNKREKGSVKDRLKEMQDTHGDVTTYAKAYAHKNSHVKDMYDAAAGDEEGEQYKAHEHAMGTLLKQHATEAIDKEEKQRAQVQAAEKLGPEDCPHIAGLTKSIKFFGHQAETLAKLNVLQSAIVDVDMGGGKGLIIPADALNLMAQGKVKKPLIVVPANTLDQNAELTVGKYTKGKLNVFKITNDSIKKQYKGDLNALLKDINDAPPNTIFMTSYDTLSYNFGKGDLPESEWFERAKSISSAKWDYVHLDESHNIKNVKSNKFAALQHFTRAKYKRCASGTFVSNNPADVIGQAKFLHPGLDWKEDKFKQKYGFDENKKGVKWSEQGLHSLRQDLKSLGMVSIRRSAWIDKLPERNENVSVVKPDKHLAGVNEAAINDVLDQLQEEAKSNPKLRKLLEKDDETAVSGADEEDSGLPPALTGKLEILTGVMDYPDKIASLIDDAFNTLKGGGIKSSQVNKELRGKAKAKAGEEDEGEDDEQGDNEISEALEYLGKFSPSTRKALRTLKGVVSPKAKDCYEKIAAHLADKSTITVKDADGKTTKIPKNGKFIVFCQRKMSASHILENMPEEMKSQAMYYDASKKADLKEFLKDKSGPRIIVAVDASIKDGMNLQVANGMYRYDHHYSPGSQEQSYARIWRFGQQRPCDIHLGVVDGGLDVTKYARMVSKLHQNQLVTSDMPSDETFRAYKLSIDNIRDNRSADILPQYTDKVKKILAFQHEENKTLKKKYAGEGGTGMYDRSNDTPIGGSKAKPMHGQGPYHEYGTKFDEGEHDLDDNEKDQLLGHFRDQHKKIKGGNDQAFNRDVEGYHFPEAMTLARRHKASGGGDKISDATLKGYRNEYDKKNKKNPMSDKAMELYRGTVNDWLKKPGGHTPHEKVDHAGAVKNMIEEQGRAYDPKKAKNPESDAKALMAAIGSKKIEHLGDGKTGDTSFADKFWKSWAKKYDTEDVDPKYRKLVEGAVAKMHENQGGYQAVKHMYEDEDKDKES